MKNKPIYFKCELETKDKDILIIELEDIIKKLKEGYTNINWNTNIDIF